MSTLLGLQELLKVGFEDFVIPSYESVSYSAITNRAKVTRSLKAIAGVEPIMCRGLNKLGNEFGPSGETVWEEESGDLRVRFVGNKWTMLDDSYGVKPWSTTSGEFIEVTFWGTGLTLLTNLDNNASRDWRVTTDNGTEGSNIYTASYSNVLGAKSWNANAGLTVVSGLSLGWHTVRIKSYNTGGLGVFGFQVLNERSDLAVYSGSAISKGNLTGTSSLLTSSFKDGVVGTKGARVVKYIQNGALKSAVQMVDSTALYLSNADHTNEDIFRRLNFREFGSSGMNLVDGVSSFNFSALNTTGTSRAFTTEDGLTTLTGSLIGTYSDAGIEMLGFGSTSAYTTITFEGTGLDIIVYSNTTANTLSFWIDGVIAGSVTPNALGQIKYKVASGLSYGTHTCKVTISGAMTGATGLTDFLIYQPKEPSIPEGAQKVADYCVVADYAIALAEGVDRISTGVIRNHITRNVAYVGTWSTLSLSVGNIIGGWVTNSTTVGSYIELKFWGTGFDYRLNSEANQTQTISVDGSSNFSSLTTQLIHSGATWTAASGTVTGNGGVGGVLSVNGLSLGWHTVRVTLTASTGGGLYPEAFDIITPIRSNDVYSSGSLKSNVKYSPLTKRKIQRKSFSDGSNSSVGTFPILALGNLTIGKTYRISGYVGGSGVLNGTNVNCILLNGNTTPNYLWSFGATGNNYLSTANYVNFHFKANATSVLICRNNGTGSSSSSGVSGTVILEEIPDVDVFTLR